jgi:hypothetical protein
LFKEIIAIDFKAVWKKEVSLNKGNIKAGSNPSGIIASIILQFPWKCILNSNA